MVFDVIADIVTSCDHASLKAELVQLATSIVELLNGSVLGG